MTRDSERPVPPNPDDMTSGLIDELRQLGDLLDGWLAHLEHGLSLTREERRQWLEEHVK